MDAQSAELIGLLELMTDILRLDPSVGAIVLNAHDITQRKAADLEQLFQALDERIRALNEPKRVACVHESIPCDMHQVWP
jgi:hypothetical protein